MLLRSLLKSGGEKALNYGETFLGGVMEVVNVFGLRELLFRIAPDSLGILQVHCVTFFKLYR